MADRGIGIPKERQPKMFTRFYQVENPLTRKVGGSGLGLSICKEFVEALGGRIWFESHVGKGTTFYFTLPIKSKIFAANKYQKQQPDE
jgi:signal transduction histidine kinase